MVQAAGLSRRGSSRWKTRSNSQTASRGNWLQRAINTSLIIDELPICTSPRNKWQIRFSCDTRTLEPEARGQPEFQKWWGEGLAGVGHIGIYVCVREALVWGAGEGGDCPMHSTAGGRDRNPFCRDSCGPYKKQRPDNIARHRAWAQDTRPILSPGQVWGKRAFMEALLCIHSIYTSSRGFPT